MSERGDEDKSGGDGGDEADAQSKRASVDDGAHGDDGDDVAEDGRGATDARAGADDSDGEDRDADGSDGEQSDGEDSEAEDSGAEDSDAEDSEAEGSEAEDSDAEDSEAEDSDGEQSDAEDGDGGDASPAGGDGDSPKAADGDDAPSSPLSKLWWLLPIAVVVEFWIYGHNGYIDVCVGKEGETDFALAGKERTDENRWKFPRCETRLNLGLRGEFEAKKAEATKVACRGATLFKNRGQAAQCEAAKDGWIHQVDARFCPPWDPNYYEHLFWFLK